MFTIYIFHVDDIKLLMAKEGACELLFNLLEEHKDLVLGEKGKALMKLACDLIVLIITGGICLIFRIIEIFNCML